MNATLKEHEHPTGPFADFQAASPIHQDAKRKKYAGKDDPVCTPVETIPTHQHRAVIEPGAGKITIDPPVGSEIPIEVKYPFLDEPLKVKEMQVIKYVDATPTFIFLWAIIIVLAGVLGMYMYGDLVERGVL